jgi:hypothetical protein
MLIKLYNRFLEQIFSKYIDDKNLLDLKLIGNSEICTYGKKIIFYEMIRIKINCKIDELKDVFDNIQPKTFIDEKNDITVSMNLNNLNKDCWRITKLFTEVISKYLNEMKRV